MIKHKLWNAGSSIVTFLGVCFETEHEDDHVQKRIFTHEKAFTLFQSGFHRKNFSLFWCQFWKFAISSAHWGPLEAQWHFDAAEGELEQAGGRFDSSQISTDLPDMSVHITCVIMAYQLQKILICHADLIPVCMCRVARLQVEMQ